MNTVHGGTSLGGRSPPPLTAIESPASTRSIVSGVGLQHAHRFRVDEQDFAMLVGRHLLEREPAAPRERRDVTELADAWVAVTFPETHADGSTQIGIGAAREQQLGECCVAGPRRLDARVVDPEARLRYDGTKERCVTAEAVGI